MTFMQLKASVCSAVLTKLTLSLSQLSPSLYLFIVQLPTRANTPTIKKPTSLSSDVAL